MRVDSVHFKDCPSIKTLRIHTTSEQIASLVKFEGDNNVERLLMTGRLFSTSHKRDATNDLKGLNFDSIKEIVLAENGNKEMLNWVKVLHWQKERDINVYGAD